MNSTDLIRAFRERAQDTQEEYFWRTPEVLAYLNDAYFTFARLIGGIRDFGGPDSPWMSAELYAGEPFSPLPPCLLRTMSATLRSKGRALEVLNPIDYESYGGRPPARRVPPLVEGWTGPVRSMILGLRKGVARWVETPADADVADLVGYRLPLCPITEPDQELVDVEPQHQPYLVEWMLHLAYGKQDADAFDEQASLRARAVFEAYCERVRAELDRYVYRPGLIRYGGL